MHGSAVRQFRRLHAGRGKQRRILQAFQAPIEKITSEVEKLTEEITAGTTDSTKNDTAEETEMSQDVKYIALTFDDGPNATTTNDVIDKLEKYDIVASFFLIGNNINDESCQGGKARLRPLAAR